MDAWHFDRLTRALAAGVTPRRGVLGLLAGGVLGILAGRGDEAAAHDPFAKCRKIDNRKKRKKCIKRAKKHNAARDAEETGPECATDEDCDDGLFCNGEETCGEDGSCQPGMPPCDDAIACTSDACDEGSQACLHTADSSQCGANEVCDPQLGCVCQSGFVPCGGSCFQAGAACNTGQLGPCASGILVCDGSRVICQRTYTPVPETCNGLDDDCDGLVDEGPICPAGQRCQLGACCKENGFEAEHACIGDTECCSGNCATHDFGTTCRPEGCLPTGGDCSSGPSVCCSVTCGGGKCQ